MTLSYEYLSENIYSLNPNITRQQLMNAIHRSLLKSEALAMAATIVELDVLCKETIDNYLWAVLDAIQEARILYESIKDSH